MWTVTASPVPPDGMLPKMRTPLPKTTFMRVELTLTFVVSTWTAPVNDVFVSSWYEYDDSTSNWRDHVSPGFSTGDLNSPVSETTWCSAVSLFFQATVSPGLTVTSSGLKPVDVIDTVAVACRDEFSAVATEATAPSANVATISSNAFFIVSKTP